MLFSLDSGIDVEMSETDMRHLWFSGSATQAMPNLFTPAGGAQSLSRVQELFVEDQSAEDLIDSAARQGLSAYEITLADEPGFAVSKVLMSGASVTDATYFEACERFADFAAFLHHPEPRVQYSGSLFM